MIRWKDKKLDEISATKIGRNWVTYGLLFLAMGAMTFFGVCDPMTGSMGNMASLSGVAATVGDEDISGMDFRRAYQDAYSRYQRQFSEGFDPAALQLSRMVMNQLVNQRVMYDLAVKNGIYSADPEVEAVLVDVEIFRDDKGQFSVELFDRFLKNNRFSEEAFTEEMRRNLTSDKLRRFVTDTYHMSNKAAQWRYRLSETKMNVEYLRFESKNVKVDVSDADVSKFLEGEGKDKVKQYYERNKKDYNQEKKVKASHILIAYKDARNAEGDAANRSKEDAKKKAEEILAEIKGGGDFAALAKKYTDDQSGKSNGGDLGFFTADTMVKEFSDVAFKLNKGEVSSQPVESPFGFHIIRVADIQEAKSTPLENASRDIARKLLAEEQKPKMLEELAKSTLTSLKEGKDVSGVLASHNLSWDNTGKFALSANNIPKLGSNKDLKAAAFSLSKKSRLSPEVITVGSTFYVLRLKDWEDADMSKFDEKKQQELAETSSYMESYTVYNALAQATQKQYEDKGKIWVNEEYRDLDLRRQAQDENARGG